MMNILSTAKGMSLQFNSEVSPALDYFFNLCLKMRLMERFPCVPPTPPLTLLAGFADGVFLESACAIPQTGLCCH